MTSRILLEWIIVYFAVRGTINFIRANGPGWHGSPPTGATCAFKSLASFLMALLCVYVWYMGDHAC